MLVLFFSLLFFRADNAVPRMENLICCSLFLLLFRVFPVQSLVVQIDPKTVAEPSDLPNVL